MHHCLQLPELLFLIFSFLVQGDSDFVPYAVHQHRSGRSTLRALACTCRDFFDPALDVLWGSGCHFASLLSVLPQSQLTYNETGIFSASIIPAVLDDACLRIRDSGPSNFRPKTYQPPIMLDSQIMLNESKF